MTGVYAYVPKIPKGGENREEIAIQPVGCFLTFPLYLSLVRTHDLWQNLKKTIILGFFLFIFLSVCLFIFLAYII